MRPMTEQEVTEYFMVYRALVEKFTEGDDLALELLFLGAEGI